MQQNAELPVVSCFEKRTILRSSQSVAADVAQQNHAIHFQFIDRATQFFQSCIRIIHGDRSESFESCWVLRDQFCISIVDHARDFRLMRSVSEENVWG